MPPSAQSDSIIIALDVGRSVSNTNSEDKKSFFQQSRECVSWIIQRKIASRSTDFIGLLLIGSESSDNRIAISGYNNISCKFDLQYASWDMLKFIENDVQTTEHDSDWIGALIVAIEMLKVHEEYNVVKNKKIVFFSDFSKPASDDLNIIIKSIKALDIKITIIGLKNISFFAELLEDEEGIDSDDDNEPAAKKRKKSSREDSERTEGEKLVFELWRRLPNNTVVCTFESALKQLCSYTRKAIRVTPWNCIMDIGDVKINISMLKKTDPKSAMKFDTKYLKPPGENSLPGTSSQNSEESCSTIRDKVMYYKHLSDDNKGFENIEVKEEDTVEGFRYGTTVIPFSAQDKQALEYKSGPKCFSVIGFTKISSVPYYLLSGDSSYVVVPRDKDENSEVALSAIVQAMKKTECLAIVRRVYSDNRGLSLGILYPLIEEIDNEDAEEVPYKEYLLFVELAFKNDVKNVKFPSLKPFAEEITKEQYDAVDKLIDEMNLMKADRGLRGELCEAFDLSTLHDFKEQFFQYCVIQKGLYPEKRLPTTIPPYIQKFIEQPKEIEEKCKETVEELKKLFKIKRVEKDENVEKGKTKGNGEEDKNEINSATTPKHFTKDAINNENNVVKKGWMVLFMKAFPTHSILENFLHKLLKVDQVNEEEILLQFKNVFKEIRQVYTTINPSLYNWWMKKFKIWCCESEDLGSELWNVITEGDLGLVSNKENDLSYVSETEAENFLKQNIKLQTSFENKKQKSPTMEMDPELMSVDSFY